MGLSKYSKQKVCPECGSKNCEEIIKHDKHMPKARKRVCWLCYDCGASETTPPFGKE